MKRFPVLGGSDAFIAFEQLHEILFIRETACICDFVDGKRAVGEQVFGDGDPDAVDIGQDRIAGIFFKYIGQVGRVLAELLCDIGHAERPVIVGADPFDHIQNIGRYAGIQKMADLE